MSLENQSNIVDKVILGRKSVRAFLPTPISEKTIVEILKVASRAPSGSNTQPWRVYVLQGAIKEKLSNTIKEVASDPIQNALHRPEYIYYPKNWTEPFISRRRKVGIDLYKLLGIAREDTKKMQTQHFRNYDFFDAPVALVCTIPRIMEQGSWLDYGMFIQNILIAAGGRGIQTCPQAAFISYHQIVQDVVGFPSEEQLVCCIAMGYEDTSKIENTLTTERVPVDDFVSFVRE
jgi:nitroreductase